MNNSVPEYSAFQNDTLNSNRERGSVTELKTTIHSVQVPTLRSEWITPIGEKLNELQALPFGWDGYNGKPVSFSCADFAARIIERLCLEGVSAPQLVPGNDGTIQFEWHVNGYDIEVDVLGQLDAIATRYCQRSDNEEEIKVDSDITKLDEWVRALRPEQNEASSTGA